MITKYIDLKFFLISLCVGFFFVYIFTPYPDVVIMYPTPENAGKIVYKDAADVCYKYRADEVSCPDDKSKIVDTNIQHVDIEKSEKRGFFETMSKKMSGNNK